jgi:F420-non-reducing hydrogenase iron-sulfur subunit
MAGVSRLQYPTEIRVIRVTCSGRVDLEFVLRALANGMDGVFIGGCRLGECNYITQGNYHALNMVLLCRKIMEYLGLNPERLGIKFMSSGEGNIFTEAVDQFTRTIRQLGPLGQGEELNQEVLKSNLEAVQRLVPYLKLVERQRLRIPYASEEECQKYFASPEVDRLFQELIVDKLAISRIMSQLRARPLSTGELAESLGLSPSEVSRHINSSSNQGLINYDEDRKSYALA